MVDSTKAPLRSHLKGLSRAFRGGRGSGKDLRHTATAGFSGAMAVGELSAALRWCFKWALRTQQAGDVWRWIGMDGK